MLLEKYSLVVRELLASLSARAELADKVLALGPPVRDKKPQLMSSFLEISRNPCYPHSRESEKQNWHSLRLGTEPFPRGSRREQNTVRARCLLMATLQSSTRKGQVILAWCFSQQKTENKSACWLETNARATRNLKKYNTQEKCGCDLESWKSPPLHQNEAVQTRCGN